MSNTNSEILVAGAVAAFSVDLLVYPLDTLKTRWQSPDYARIYLNGSTGAINRPALFRGLYQGVGSVILATLPSSGAFFTTYEAIKSLLKRHNPTNPYTSSPLLPTPLIHATASSIAELVSCVILTPAEVLKQNAQMVQQSPSSPKTAKPATSAAKINANATIQTLRRFRSHPSQLFTGYTALAARNLPFTALQFPMFEHLKQAIYAYRADKHSSGNASLNAAPPPPSLWETGTITAVSAGSAGSVAALVTTPVDVVKTRVMLAASSSPSSSSSSRSSPSTSLPSSSSSSAKPPPSSSSSVLSSSSHTSARPSSLQTAKNILRDEGPRALWRGGLLRAAWTALGSGLYLGVYESGRVWLARRDGEEE
ncbi:MAG: hypothetical protein M1819_000210 [Sarea resinae]|nr:MAG: hypothetical protein M1819_000210 [Sarea resinae]